MEHSVFAMEICARLEPESPLRVALREVVAEALPRLSLHQKWQQYQRATALLLDNLHLAERGCWDYFDNDERARHDYDMWTQGMLTREGVRQQPSGLPDPYRGDPRYLTFTMALLMQQGSPSDRMVQQLCNIPEARLWHKDSFARILRGLGQVSFASVKSDVIYLIPRDDGWGLTAQDLTAKKFEYLRPMT